MQAPVANEAVGIIHSAVAEKSEGAQAIVDGDDDDVTPAHQLSAPVEEDRAAARGESTAVDPHHDRTSPLPGGALGDLRCPDVERQTVLALRVIGPGIGRTGDTCLCYRLGGDRPERGCLAHALPLQRGLRRAPPEHPFGRSGVGNTGNDQRSPRRTPRIRPAGDRNDAVHGSTIWSVSRQGQPQRSVPGSLTSPGYGTLDVETGARAPSHEGEGVTVSGCHQCIVGTLDAPPARILCPRRARRFHSRAGGNLCLQSRRGRARRRRRRPSGPAPNQSQINASKSQVSAIAATLSQEEQETSALDNRYDTAMQNLQTAQAALQTINTNDHSDQGAVWWTGST
jgi:hypothetical protein